MRAALRDLALEIVSAAAAVLLAVAFALFVLGCGLLTWVIEEAER